MSNARLEAFSDGVIAVAITLLVLNVTVPALRPHEQLAHALGAEWPKYAAYAISFLTIGIIWINHHAMIGRLRTADHTIMFLNLVLLMTVVLIPFVTDLMAQYLRESSGEHLAAGIYAGCFLVMSLAFSTLNHHILFAKAHLLVDPSSDAIRRATFRRATAGVVPYVIATAVAPLSPYATLAICGALAAFYALPLASGVTLSDG